MINTRRSHDSALRVSRAVRGHRDAVRANLYHVVELRRHERSDPIGALVQATNGDLYGSNITLGANGQGGTIFKIGTDAMLTTLARSSN